MIRLFSYTISDNNFAPTINDFLKSQGFGAKILTVLRHTTGSVFLNKKEVLLKTSINIGDLIEIIWTEDTSSEHIPPVKLPLDIIYEDEDIMVINKPANMPIHPSLNHYENTLGNALAFYFKEKETPFVFRCVNRLDKNTTGLTLIAKNRVAGGILSASLSDKKSSGLHREYLAICKGKVSPSEGQISAPISRVDGSTIERKVDFENGEGAVTNYKVINEKNGHSLVSLVLETGRTHQIRVHMKYLGYPLIGDYLYNPDMEKMSRQALHSYKLSFIHPISKEKMDFTAPLPADMAWMN